jgi:hypothetical protein
MPACPAISRKTKPQQQRARGRSQVLQNPGWAGAEDYLERRERRRSCACKRAGDIRAHLSRGIA